MFCWHNVLSSKGKSFKILPGDARIGGVIGGMIGQTSRTTTMHEPTWIDACQTGAWLPSCTNMNCSWSRSLIRNHTLSSGFVRGVPEQTGEVNLISLFQTCPEHPVRTTSGQRGVNEDHEYPLCSKRCSEARYEAR